MLDLGRGPDSEVYVFATVSEHINQGITVALHGLIMGMRHNQSVIRPVLCVYIYLKEDELTRWLREQRLLPASLTI